MKTRGSAHRLNPSEIYGMALEMTKLAGDDMSKIYLIGSQSPKGRHRPNDYSDVDFKIVAEKAELKRCDIVKRAGRKGIWVRRRNYVEENKWFVEDKFGVRVEWTYCSEKELASDASAIPVAEYGKAHADDLKHTMSI